MKHKEISIALQTNKSLVEYGKVAKSVENYGFDRLTVYNDLLYQPAWFPLYACAEVTSTIKLGPAAVNPFTSHPINIAGNISLLNEKSQGRVYLGLAKGAWLNFLGITPPKPVKALREAFLSITHLLKQNKDPLPGEFFSLDGGDSLRWSMPKTKIPMLLGSWGDRTIFRCLSFIDEVKLGGSANPDIVRVYKAKIEGLVNELSLEKKCGIVMGGVCVVDEDGEQAKILAKKEVSLYLPVIAQLDPTFKIAKRELKQISKAVEVFDFETASEYISDEMLKKFAFAGTPEEIITQTQDLFDAGADRVEFGTPHGLEGTKGIQLLGEQVLPAVMESIGGKV